MMSFSNWSFERVELGMCVMELLTRKAIALDDNFMANGKRFSLPLSEFEKFNLTKIMFGERPTPYECKWVVPDRTKKDTVFFKEFEN